MSRWCSRGTGTSGTRQSPCRAGLTDLCYCLIMDTEQNSSGGRGPLALKIAAVVLAVAAVYLGLLWMQMGQTLQRGQQVQDSVNSTVSSLNRGVETFEGDPKSAEKLQPALERARSALADARKDIDGIIIVTLPPVAPMQSRYRSQLASYTTDVDRYVERIQSNASFVIARSKLVQSASQGLGALGDLAKPGVSEQEVRQGLDNARAAVEGAATQLRSLVASSGPIYSNQQLLSRLAALGAVLKDIGSGIAEKDAQKIAQATKAFSQILSGDWQSTLYSGDKTRIAETSKQLEAIRDRAASISSLRQELANTRATVGLLALVFGVAAAFSAAVAWLR